MNESGPDMERIVNQATEVISAWGLRVLGAIALLVAGWLVCKMVRSFVRRALRRSQMDATLVPFFSNLVYYVLLACVVVAVLGLVGIQTTSLIAVLGAAGLAIGLALQGTLSSFAAGVMLLIFRPFRLGDVVEIAGDVGKVHEIGLFATHLDTPDNVRIIVPNAQVWGARIKNFAINDTRRVDMVFGVGYDDDLDRARATIVEVIAADARVLKDPETVVAVAELADSSVNFVARPWCKREDYWGLKWDLTRQIKDRLEAAGCSIPFPQRDVHLHEAGKGDAAA